MPARRGRLLPREQGATGWKSKDDGNEETPAHAGSPEPPIDAYGTSCG